MGIGTGESLRPCSEVFDVNDMDIECSYSRKLFETRQEGQLEPDLAATL